MLLLIWGWYYFIPAVNVFYQAFKGGIGEFFGYLTTDDFVSAVGLTLLIALIVVPVNAVFGLCAAWVLARNRFPGRAFVMSILDVPFSVSPVVAGLMMILLYGQNGWFGGILEAINIMVIFAFPGMVVATAFVTMPFVAREVIPVLEEIGFFSRGSCKYFGCESMANFLAGNSTKYPLGFALWVNFDEMPEQWVNSGRYLSYLAILFVKPQTLPLFVEQAYKQYETETAFAAAVLLACFGICNACFEGNFGT